MPKIYISGGPGSGKTTYAKKLSQELNIPCLDCVPKQQKSCQVWNKKLIDI